MFEAVDNIMLCPPNLIEANESKMGRSRKVITPPLSLFFKPMDLTCC